MVTAHSGLNSGGMRARRPASPRRPPEGPEGGGHDQGRAWPLGPLPSRALTGGQGASDRRWCVSALAAATQSLVSALFSWMVPWTALQGPGCCSLVLGGRPLATPYPGPTGTGPEFSCQPLPANPSCLTGAARPPGREHRRRGLTQDQRKIPK